MTVNKKMAVIGGWLFSSAAQQHCLLLLRHTHLTQTHCNQPLITERWHCKKKHFLIKHQIIFTLQEFYRWLLFPKGNHKNVRLNVGDCFIVISPWFGLINSSVSFYHVEDNEKVLVMTLNAQGQNYTTVCSYTQMKDRKDASNWKKTFLKLSSVTAVVLYVIFDVFLVIISFSETGKHLYMRWQRSWARYKPRMLLLCGTSCRPMSHQKTTFSTSYLKRSVREMLVIILHWSSVAVRGSQQVIGLCDCIFWLCLRGMRWKEGSEILIIVPFVSCCALPCSLLDVSF